jgi:hypothetical protein
VNLKCIRRLGDGSQCPNDAREDSNYCVTHEATRGRTRQGKKMAKKKAAKRK